MPRKTINIYAGEDFERLGDLRRAVAVAERAAAEATAVSRRFGDDDNTAADVQAAKDAYDAFVDEAAERAEEWLIESIGHEAWRELLAAHPARKVDGEDGKKVDHPEDAQWGFNSSTFPKALLLFVDAEDPEHRTVVKAGDIDLAGLARRVRRLSEGEFETLWATAYALNTGGLRDPKDSVYSTAPKSAAT